MKNHTLIKLNSEQDKQKYALAFDKYIKSKEIENKIAKRLNEKALALKNILKNKDSWDDLFKS